ncbi:MAG: hypothetical protein J2P49_01780 [Methylocapsa sp.]|nr:hypothetical protein [Methylocapsa sp.]
MAIEPDNPQSRARGPRAPVSYYRKIGISAVAAALEALKPAQKRKDPAAILRDEAA